MSGDDVVDNGWYVLDNRSVATHHYTTTGFNHVQAGTLVEPFDI
jgi:hypothetical protein